MTMVSRSSTTSKESNLQDRIRQVIRKIPKGRVAGYGQIAALAGNPRAARLVVWTLNASRNEKLPWFRVINSQGKIALKPGQGYELQRALLVEEGIVFSDSGKIDLGRFQWRPKKIVLR
ncbi:MAG TPA: MGMT family protein [candidate division Zixibacteria bacterium]|nr:MGMT family protein [candidate division Zixibacteria bacterium]